MSLSRVRAPGVLIALLLWPGFLLAQNPDPGPLSDARRGIDRGNADYIAAFAKADPDGVAAVYDADGVRLLDDGKVLRGRGAIAHVPGTARSLLIFHPPSAWRTQVVTYLPPTRCWLLPLGLKV